MSESENTKETIIEEIIHDSDQNTEQKQSSDKPENSGDTKNITLSTDMPSKKFPEQRCRIIGILSGKGGVGKTFISSTLSYGLAAKGLSVLVIDMDTGLRNLDIVMGLDDDVIHNLFDTLERGIPYENILVKAKGYKGDNVPWVILTSHLHTKNAISGDAFRGMLDKARERFDIILLDGPAGIEYGADIVAESSDELFIVCNQEKPSLRAGCQIKSKYIHRCPLYLIMNSYSPAFVEKNDGGLSPEKAAMFTGLDLIAAVPWDLRIRPCGHRGIPVWYCGNDFAAKNVIEELAHNLYQKMYAGENTSIIPGVPKKEPDIEPDKKEDAEQTDLSSIPNKSDNSTSEPKKTELSKPKGFWSRIFGGKK